MNDFQYSIRLSKDCPLAHDDDLLSSKGFLNLWQTLKGKPLYWSVYQDEKLLAVLTGVEFGRTPLKRFQAMPDGLFSRIQYVEQQDQFDANEMCKALKKKLFKDKLYQKIDLVDYYHQLPSDIFDSSIKMTTHLVELKDIEWEPPDKKLQSEIRKAEREGVKIQSFTASRHLSGFLQLMLQAEAEHGRNPKYPDAFFVELAALAEKENRIHWWYCEYENQPVASHIYFILGNTALNWQIYNNKKYSSLKANQLMQYTAIKACFKAGATSINLGVSPDNATGLKRYKEKWGTKEYTYPIFQYRTLLGKLR